MRVEDNDRNRTRCLCGTCPSRPRGAPVEERLFCARGASRGVVDVRGCACAMCPVWHEYQLLSPYWCDREETGPERLLVRRRRPGEDPLAYEAMLQVKQVAMSGRSAVASMGAGWSASGFLLDQLHFLPAQAAAFPLNSDEAVNTSVVLGPLARQPLALPSPVMVSALSYGAVSAPVKIIVARVSESLGVAYCTGEGGVLEEERGLARRTRILQYASGRFGVTEQLLQEAAAVEIRLGQGAYPGKGSFLPAGKMTAEVAAARGLADGEDARSPARHPDISSPAQLRDKVQWLRRVTSGVPVGAKIGCSRVEEDVRALVEAGVDFIVLDGFGGGTGAVERYARDHSGIPIVAALPRARRCLQELGMRGRVSLVAAGGLRSGADCARCLALGADAVYLGTAVLMAIGCEQYRVCHSGLCPTGIATHRPSLLRQLDVAEGVRRLTNFLAVCTDEMAGLARIVGKNDVRLLDAGDLVALSPEAARVAGVQMMDGRE